jgi:hypothetical protein
MVAPQVSESDNQVEPSSHRHQNQSGYIEIGPQIFVEDTPAGPSNSRQVTRSTTIPPVQTNEQWYDDKLSDDICLEVSKNVENAGLCDEQGKIYINI